MDDGWTKKVKSITIGYTWAVTPGTRLVGSKALPSFFFLMGIVISRYKDSHLTNHDSILEPQGQPFINGWMEMVISKHFLYQDLVKIIQLKHLEPNLDIENGWKSPFPSIYKWLELGFQDEMSRLVGWFLTNLKPQELREKFQKCGRVEDATWCPAGCQVDWWKNIC